MKGWCTMDEKTKWKSIDEYICNFPDEIQSILKKIRAVIKKNAPDAIETISYQMPAFKFEGILVYFAVHTAHIGFYPTSSGIEMFKKELAGYTTSKGAVQFPLDKPVPYELIGKIAQFRVKENLERAAVKIKKKRSKR
jgi:uncharacterized protein YdhG (YjbR/CyaY superfamily)